MVNSNQLSAYMHYSNQHHTESHQEKHHPPRLNDSVGPAFGSVMQTRSYSARAGSTDGYRYGFNGTEKESDGTADNYDFRARIYNGRLGRWLSVDPLLKDYASFSTFQISFNSPIYFRDADGEVIKGLDNNEVTMSIATDANDPNSLYTFMKGKGADHEKAYELGHWEYDNLKRDLKYMKSQLAKKLANKKINEKDYNARFAGVDEKLASLEKLY